MWVVWRIGSVCHLEHLRCVLSHLVGVFEGGMFQGVWRAVVVVYGPDLVLPNQGSLFKGTGVPGRRFRNPVSVGVC